jgi:hypothetical protein
VKLYLHSPKYAFMAWYSVKKKHRDNFTVLQKKNNIDALTGVSPLVKESALLRLTDQQTNKDTRNTNRLTGEFKSYSIQLIRNVQVLALALNHPLIRAQYLNKNIQTHVIFRNLGPQGHPLSFFNILFHNLVMRYSYIHPHVY